MNPQFLAPVLAAVVVGYVLGSVSFAVIVARRHGVDIMKAGSGNPGATNVKRVVGKGPGNLVFALDVLKGALASGWPALVVLGWNLFSGGAGVDEAAAVVDAAAVVGPAAETAGATAAAATTAVAWFDVSGWPAMWAANSAALAFAQLAGFAGAVLGHCFSVFLRFRGGKGVAVSAGGLLGAMPVCLGAAAIVWLAVYFLSRYVFMASLVAGLSLPVTAWFWFGGAGAPQFWLALAIAIFFLYTHRQNIRRFLNGTENRFSKKPPEDPPPAA